MDGCPLCGGDLNESTVVDEQGLRVIRWCRICGRDVEHESPFFGW